MSCAKINSLADIQAPFPGETNGKKTIPAERFQIVRAEFSTQATEGKQVANGVGKLNRTVLVKNLPPRGKGWGAGIG
jgi:hypothetical protein